MASLWFLRGIYFTIDKSAQLQQLSCCQHITGMHLRCLVAVMSILQISFFCPISIASKSVGRESESIEVVQLQCCSKMPKYSVLKKTTTTMNQFLFY